jgi:hypothetical protein
MSGQAKGHATARWISIVTMVVGAIMVIAGAATYANVSSTLADQRITVSDDADCRAGQLVTGPIDAYCQALVINHHALEATDGKTYAELDREDPLRETAMTASFLQASLYTSVVAFGVAFMAIAIGIVFVLLGIAVLNLVPPKEETATAPSTM